MKNIILLFIFAAQIAQAQTTTKTFTLVSGTYYEVVRITQENGSYVETSNLVGAAADLTGDQADKIEQGAALIAQAAQTVENTKRLVSLFNQADSTITAIIGNASGSPLKRIQDRYVTEFTTSGWTIDEGAGAGFIPCSFSVSAQGVLRLSINGGSNKTVKSYGQILRVSNYPSNGSNMFFYLSANGKKYISMDDKQQTIKKP